MPAREGLERDRVKSGTWRTTHALGREHQKHALTYTGEELFGGTSSNPQTGPEGWGSGTEAKQEPRGEDNRKQPSEDEGTMSRAVFPSATRHSLITCSRDLCWILDASMLSQTFPNPSRLGATFSPNANS